MHKGASCADLRGTAFQSSGQRASGICNTYTKNGTTRGYRYTHRPAEEVHTRREMKWLIYGDSSFEGFGDRSYRADRVAFMDSTASENLALAWNQCEGDPTEHYQPDFTRAQTGPYGTTFSRIDRMYSNIPAWRLLTIEVRTPTVGHATDERAA